MQTDEPKNRQNNSDEKPPNIWDVLEERKKKGLWDGEIDVVPIKEYPLTAGEHYYELTDIRKREVTCKSCAIKHGGILEAHLLMRYKVENGVIYLDNKPVTRAPQKGS